MRRRHQASRTEPVVVERVEEYLAEADNRQEGQHCVLDPHWSEGTAPRHEGKDQEGLSDLLPVREESSPIDLMLPAKL